MIARIRRLRSALPATLALVAFLALAGCGGGEEVAVDEADPAATEPLADDADAMEAGGAPDVYFVNIEDGGTYTSPLEIIFGVDDFEIVPVEDPPVVREGEGHYHLAIDVECMPEGEIIPPGTPSYIHFGTGADRITSQFEPGEHTLCLQVADGEHRVLAGPENAALTEQITITIEASES